MTCKNWDYCEILGVEPSCVWILVRIYKKIVFGWQRIARSRINGVVQLNSYFTFFPFQSSSKFHIIFNKSQFKVNQIDTASIPKSSCNSNLWKVVRWRLIFMVNMWTIAMDARISSTTNAVLSLLVTLATPSHRHSAHSVLIKRGGREMKWPAFEAPYFLFSEQFSYLYGYRDVYDSINWASNNDRRKNLLAIPIHEWSRKNYFISPPVVRIYVFRHLNIGQP